MKHAKLMRTFGAAVLILPALLLSGGCEWSSGGGVDDFNNNPDKFNVQVSGVYRAPQSGDPIVTDYTSEAEPAATNTTQVSVRGERVAEGNGLATAFSGSFKNKNLVPGTVLITAPPSFTFTDNGAGGLIGSPSGSGAVNYQSGTWSLDFGGVAPAAGADIVASYTYEKESVTGETSVRSGASATTIFTLNVEQSGNQIRILDNNGDVYNGEITSSEITNQRQVSDTEQQLENAQQFTAEGLSRGIKVKMVGVFNIQETVFFAESLDASTTTLTFKLEELYRIVSLSMDGTWLEENGSTGDISAIGPQNQRIETQDLSLF